MEQVEQKPASHHCATTTPTPVRGGARGRPRNCRRLRWSEATGVLRSVIAARNEGLSYGSSDRPAEAEPTHSPQSR